MKRNPRRTAPGFRIPVPYNPLTGKYAPLGPEKDHQAIVLFEATSALVYADPLDATAPTLTARKWVYDKTTGERAVDEAETETTVYMSIADFDGEAYLGVAHIAEGDHFWAVLDSQAGRWEVVMQSIGGEHWGKLDADLAWNDTVGVDVEVWAADLSAPTGQVISNVLPPWTMRAGLLDEGSRVLIRLIGGIWRVVLAECAEETEV